MFSKIVLDLSSFDNKETARFRLTCSLLRWKMCRGSGFVLSSDFGTILFEDIASNKDALSSLLSILDVHNVPRIISVIR